MMYNTLEYTFHYSPVDSSRGSQVAFQQDRERGNKQQAVCSRTKAVNFSWGLKTNNFYI